MAHTVTSNFLPDQEKVAPAVWLLARLLTGPAKHANSRNINNGLPLATFTKGYKGGTGERDADDDRDNHDVKEDEKLMRSKRQQWLSPATIRSGATDNTA